MRKRLLWGGIFALLVVSVVGFVASLVMRGASDDYRAYGEVPVPGSDRLHLPAGDVVVGFHLVMPANEDDPAPLPTPRGLELIIAAPSGVPQPTATEIDNGGTVVYERDAHHPMKVVHIAVAGDYTITANAPEEALQFTTNGKALENPRLSFGHYDRYGFWMWLFGGLFLIAALIGVGSSLYRRAPGVRGQRRRPARSRG